MCNNVICDGVICNMCVVMVVGYTLLIPAGDPSISLWTRNRDILNNASVS